MSTPSAGVERKKEARLRRLAMIVKALVEDDTLQLEQAMGRSAVPADTRVQLHQHAPGLYYGNDGRKGALPGPGHRLDPDEEAPPGSLAAAGVALPRLAEEDLRGVGDRGRRGLSRGRASNRVI